MQLKYLKFMKKWCLVYKGRAISVGNTQAEAIEEGFTLLKQLKKIC